MTFGKPGVELMTQAMEHPKAALAMVGLPAGAGALARASVPYVSVVARTGERVLENPVVGGALGAYQGYQLGGPWGAVEGAVAGAAGSKALPKVIQTLKGPSFDERLLSTLKEYRSTQPNLVGKAQRVGDIADYTPTPGPSLGSPVVPSEEGVTWGRGGLMTRDIVARQQAQGLPVNPELLTVIQPRGGRLNTSPVRRGPMTQLQQLDEMLQSLRQRQMVVEVPREHPLGGGYTVPPSNAEGLNKNAGGALGGKRPASLTVEELVAGARPRTETVSLPEQSAGPSVTMSPAAEAAARGMTPSAQARAKSIQSSIKMLEQAREKLLAKLLSGEYAKVERTYRALHRRIVLSESEQLQHDALEKIVKERARGVGLSFASGGKKGIP
jgi:hypothetical protein